MLSRIIAGATAVLSMPLMLLGMAWFPASLFDMAESYRRLHAPGTPSFHEGMQTHFHQTLITNTLLVGAAAAWLGYAWIAITPQPTRDRYLWLFGSSCWRSTSSRPRRFA